MLAMVKECLGSVPQNGPTTLDRVRGPSMLPRIAGRVIGINSAKKEDGALQALISTTSSGQAKS